MPAAPSQAHSGGLGGRRVPAPRTTVVWSGSYMEIPASAVIEESYSSSFEVMSGRLKLSGGRQDE